MGFFSNLFKKGEEPEQTCSDDVLGPLQWSADDEAWFGEHQGRRFSLSYELTKTPQEELRVFAREFLSDLAWLDSTLDEAKRSAKDEFEKFYAGEIEGLRWGRIHFYRYKGQPRIIADLDGGKDDRTWRIEYSGRECDGIGFDS